MKTRKKQFPVVLVALVAVGLGIWRYAAVDSARVQGPTVLYYQDSMHPWVKSEQPGKCTICLMDLTPIYEGDPGFGGSEEMVVLSTNSVTVMNVQTAPVSRRSLYRTLRVAGVLEADSTRKTILAAPAPGRIDNVTVASAGVDVEKGEVLATFYSPDLTFQTRRYIFRDRITETPTEPLMSAAFASSSRHIPMSARGSKNQPLVSQESVSTDPFFNDLLSTHAGTVIERNVFDGQYVAEGDRLFAIVDCSVLWFRFDVYESQLPWLGRGQEVVVSVPSLPGKVFPATIELIEPTLNESTRTAKVRATVPNPRTGDPGREQRPLRIGMYADGFLRAEVPEVLTVPRAAILFPGGQAYAYVERNPGAFEMRQVHLGRQGDDHWEILSGLDVGERVVSSGNVLIDAQAQFNRSVAPGPMVAQEEACDHCETSSGQGLPPELTESQQRALTGFLAVADRISSALASDDLGQLRVQAERLPVASAILVREFPEDHPWHEVMGAAHEYSQWPNPSDLDSARKTFLPFSTNIVALVQRLQREEAFASSKVYFCPMAPKPGLWFQAEAPLRNPYYGAKMLHCGEEVAAPPVVRRPKPAEAVTALPQEPEARDHSEPVPAPIAAQDQPAAPRGISRYDQAAASFKVRLTNAPVVTPETAETRTARATAESEQRAAAEGFVMLTDVMGQALAADDLEGYRKLFTELPVVLAALEKQYPQAKHMNALIRRLNTLSQGDPPGNLETARQRFVLLSNNAVEIAKQLRGQGATASTFKLYRCPMAPKPGIWLQAKGPLRNPFFGSAMLTCGEEVTP
jgi:membrane fusion protein, copper/silver efflux system